MRVYSQVSPTEWGQRKGEGGRASLGEWSQDPSLRLDPNPVPSQKAVLLAQIQVAP